MAGSTVRVLVLVAVCLLLLGFCSGTAEAAARRAVAGPGGDAAGAEHVIEADPSLS